MYRSPQWGTVNLGVDTLQGHGEQSQPGKVDYQKNHPRYPHQKEQYNPGRNQELNLPPDIFPMNKEGYNSFAPEGKAIPLPNIHERIKELIGEGVPRRQAVHKARQEASKGKYGDIGTITQKQVMQKKYQAPSPQKKISPFSEQIQEQPYM